MNNIFDPLQKVRFKGCVFRKQSNHSNKITFDNKITVVLHT